MARIIPTPLAVDMFRVVLAGLLSLLVVDASNALERHETLHGGIEREYLVYVPSSLPAGYAAPLVMALHGYTSTASGFEEAHALRPSADRHGFIVVYPQGDHFVDDREPNNAYVVTSWNDLASNQPQREAGPHCTDASWTYPRPAECRVFGRCAWTSCHDDLGFLEQVLDEVQARYAVDVNRTYLLGVSNGGMMALTLGCRKSARFAAVAAIIAQLAPGYDCGPETNLPLMHLAGAKDDTVRIDGKPGADGFIYTTDDVTISTWANSLKCLEGPVKWGTKISRDMDLNCVAYKRCNVEDQEVVSCIEPQGGHWWPGQGFPDSVATCVTELQAASMPNSKPCKPLSGEPQEQGMSLVWAFFKQFSIVPES